MGILIMATNGNYANDTAVANVIRYVTRTRINEDKKAELIMYGGFGVSYYAQVDSMIHQFEYVQNVYDIDKRNGRRMYHEVFCFTEEESSILLPNLDNMYALATECANLYFQMGFQVVYAIHFSNSKAHIHFAVNGINYMDGKKWHTSKEDVRKRELYFNEIINAYLVTRKESVSLFFKIGEQILIQPVTYLNGLI